MAALTTFTDGLQQFSSRVLSIGLFTAGAPATIASGVNFIADNISVTYPSKTATRTNQTGHPSGQRSVDDFITGSATLQLETSSTIPPLRYKAFTTTFTDADNDGDVTADAEFFYIDSVEQPENKDEERKVNITFRKIINTTTAVAS